MSHDSSSPLVFVLFRARYGWLLTVGVIVVSDLVGAGDLHAAGAAAVLTAVVTVVTFIRSDLPRLRELRRRSS